MLGPPVGEDAHAALDWTAGFGGVANAHEELGVRLLGTIGLLLNHLRVGRENRTGLAVRQRSLDIRRGHDVDLGDRVSEVTRVVGDEPVSADRHCGCQVHGLTLATRNVEDSAPLDVAVVNPWAARGDVTSECRCPNDVRLLVEHADGADVIRTLHQRFDPTRHL